jgi:hypothetical protein
MTTKYRFICFNSEDYTILGTDDEVAAREWAEDELVYDTETGLSLNDNGTASDEPLKLLGPANEEEEED